MAPRPRGRDDRRSRKEAAPRMTTITAAAESRIDADPALVLEIIRDFDGHHRHILPSAFSDYQVERGGVGAGTVTSFTTTLGGRSVRGRTVVSEPEPGVVREDVEGRDMVTQFTVSPDGAGARVAIATTWTPSGLAERLLVPSMLRHIYRQELRLLAGHAASIAGYRAAAVRI
jgi:hypothetical protein